jgi:hypothetical protein
LSSESSPPDFGTSGDEFEDCSDCRKMAFLAIPLQHFSTEARMASTNTIILKETIEKLNALL